MLDKTSQALSLNDASCTAQMDTCDRCRLDAPADQIIRRYGRESDLSGREKEFICNTCLAKERAEIEEWCA